MILIVVVIPSNSNRSNNSVITLIKKFLALTGFQIAFYLAVWLQVLFNEGLLSGARLAPGFASPNPKDYDYQNYLDHIEKGLKDETPLMYGMHPNAEIGYLTDTTETTFSTILRLRIGSQTSTGSTEGASSQVREIIQDLSGRLPRKFNLIDINDRAQALVKEVSLGHRGQLTTLIFNLSNVFLW